MQRMVGGIRTVTGSHPGTAVNPSVPQPGFFPEVMSLKVEANFFEYTVEMKCQKKQLTSVDKQ